MRGNVLIWYLRAYWIVEDRNGFCSFGEDYMAGDGTYMVAKSSWEHRR
jgi:hypothetical protein